MLYIYYSFIAPVYYCVLTSLSYCQWSWTLPLLCPLEGLIDGYTGERAALEEQLRQKDELHLILEQELHVSRRHDFVQIDTVDFHPS